jgi:rhodanese-related sulfurtransferase
LIIILTILILMMGAALYRRYVPVGQPLNHQLTGQEILLDVRDIQTAFKDPVDRALEIPYGYLKRYYKEIPDKKIVIIAEDFIEKNLAIRFLRKKGYQVKDFIIIDHESEKAHTMKCLNKCLH